MQKLHIDEFYRNTVPEGTPDCEPDPGFNYDKASYIFSFLTIVAVGQSIEDYSGFRGQDPRGISPECPVHLTLPWWDLPEQPDPLHQHQSLRDGSTASP